MIYIRSTSEDESLPSRQVEMNGQTILSICDPFWVVKYELCTHPLTEGGWVNVLRIIDWLRPELHSMKKKIKKLYCIYLDFNHFCPQPTRLAQCGRHMLTLTHREEKKFVGRFHFSSNLDLHWDDREQRKKTVLGQSE
jgi:hypothetical protein